MACGRHKMSNSYYFIVSLTLILTKVVCLYQTSITELYYPLPEQKVALFEMMKIDISVYSAIK